MDVKLLGLSRTPKLMVHFIGESSRLSLGVRRYVSDLKSSLKAQGLIEGPGESGDCVVHAVSPVVFPKGKPFVVTMGDLAPMTRGNAEVVDYNSLRARAYGLWFRRATTASFAHADRIISLSSQTTQEVIQVFPSFQAKVRTISPGIGPKFKPTGRLTHEGIRIGHYRDMNPMMMRMNERLEKMGVEFTLCSLTGVSEENIVQYYNSIDYFVDFMPYRGFGYPIVEARACGTTVLLRKDALIPSEVKQLAVLVDDELDAADKIASRVVQPLVTLPFTLERMAVETIRVYEEILK